MQVQNSQAFNEAIKKMG